MTLRQFIPCALAFFVLTLTLPAQPASAPSFEVVSIRPVPPDAPPMMRSQDFTPILPGGQYIDSRTSLLFMISFAYNVKNPSKQLTGLPNWAQNQGFAIAAKPAQDFPALPPAENLEQVRLMMRTMLTDRFNLRLHTETHQEKIFNLAVGRTSIKIPQVDPPIPPAKEGHVNIAAGDRGGRMIGNKSTMTGVAIALTIMLKQPVVDQTELKGYYDFDLHWVSETADTQSSSSLGTEGMGLIISTVQDKLGLRLTSAIGPVDYWVVDRIQQPTSN